MLLVEDDRASRQGIEAGAQASRLSGHRACRPRGRQYGLLGSERVDVMVLDLGLARCRWCCPPCGRFGSRGLSLPVIIYTARILPARLVSRADSLRPRGSSTKLGSVESSWSLPSRQRLADRWVRRVFDAGGRRRGPNVCARLLLRRGWTWPRPVERVRSRCSMTGSLAFRTSSAGREAQAVEEVIEIVGGDPRLAGAVLESVNSAFYGSARSVSDIRRACVQLGTKRVAALRDRGAGTGGVRMPDREPYSSTLTAQAWRESVYRGKDCDSIRDVQLEIEQSGRDLHPRI